MRRCRLVSIRGDERGAALVEFALIAPLLVFSLLGLFELGYNVYMQSQLQGTVQQSARKSTIEGASSSQAEIDAHVEAAVKTIAPQATVSFDRKAYASFSEVSQAEDFKDINDNGLCDNGEQFEDANGNGVWDKDRGNEGFGGARDVVLYTVDIEYPRAFGFAKLAGFSETVKFKATTVMRNQPYDEQVMIAGVGQCP